MMPVHSIELQMIEIVLLGKANKEVNKIMSYFGWHDMPTRTNDQRKYIVCPSNIFRSTKNGLLIAPMQLINRSSHQLNK